MLLAGVYWAILLSPIFALPLPCKLGFCAVEKVVESVCEGEGSRWPCSTTMSSEQTIRNRLDKTPNSILYARSNISRRASDETGSSGPALGTILGGVFGALGGLAVIGAIIYAWLAIRRVKRNHAAHEMNASSSFGGGITASQLAGQHASKDSRTSSSSKTRRSKKKPSNVGWQDPWLAPPKSPRAVPVAVKLDRPVAAQPASGKPATDEDRASDSSGMPLHVMVSRIDEEPKAIRDEL